MQENFRTKFIVNPNSANGTTAKRWPQMQKTLKTLLGEFAFDFTTGPNTATFLTRQALKDGFEMVVGVGGDGTVNEIVNGFFENDTPINPDAVFGIIERGTGCDFIKATGIPKDETQAMELLKGKKTKRIDVGKFSFIDHRGKETSRYFANITSFGMGGEVDERVNRSTKILGGKLSFLRAVLATFLTYKNKKVRLKIDDFFDEERTIMNIAVANGQFFGGGMWVAPQAKLDDGLFDVIIIGDLGLKESLFNMGKIYKGKHLTHPKIEFYRGKKVIADSDETVLLDVDGEAPGRLPAKFQILPRILNVKI